MKKTIIWLSIGILMLMLVALLVLGPSARSAPAVVAFELEQSTPTPNEQVLPSVTPASTSSTAVGIPLTGATSGAPLPSASSLIQIRDQMCVKKIPYTILALPSNATFATDTTNKVTCKSVLNIAGTQTVVCTGPTESFFTFHVTNNAVSEDFTIPLRGCPPSNNAAQPGPVSQPPTESVSTPVPQPTEVPTEVPPQPTGTEAPLPTLPISTP